MGPESLGPDGSRPFGPAGMSTPRPALLRVFGVSDTLAASSPRLGAPELRQIGIESLLAKGFDVRLVPYYSASSAIVDGKRMIVEARNNLALTLGEPDAIHTRVEDDHRFLQEHIRRFDLMHRRASRPKAPPATLPPPSEER